MAALLLLALGATACMKWDYVLPEAVVTPGHRGLYVICEGNFQYGNATLTYYDPDTGEVQQECFLRANGYKLGDVAQSATVHDSLLWVVVNNSHVVFAVGASDFVERGRIEGLPSPRFIHFVSGRKAYITQLWDNHIYIIDPARYTITGTIEVPGMTGESGSTEQMVQIGRYVYVNCWSYQRRILKIDTLTDSIVAELAIGVQPQSLAVDCYGRLWAVTDGGYKGSPYGYEPPALWRIDPEAMAVERCWQGAPGHTFTELTTDADGSTLYWLDNSVWAMHVQADTLPADPVIPARGTIYYGLTVSPYDGDIYVADAVDYMQAGCIYRFSPDGTPRSSFYAGVNPGAFAWQ